MSSILSVEITFLLWYWTTYHRDSLRDLIVTIDAYIKSYHLDFGESAT